ncbi:MAG TPA: hypothetical protein DD713_03290, partial [Nitrospiraceae bacterium]|nr:hypothetical protein [Nitrospiraceae bacterium]
MKESIEVKEELIKHPKTKIEYLSKNVQDALLRIEIIEESWVLAGIPFDHTYGRVPGEEEIRLWSIPRSTGEFLHSLIIMQKPKNILEIGASAGYSTLWLASAAATYGGWVYTCEILPEKIKLLEKNIDISKLSNIKVLEGEAKESLKGCPSKIDFVFLDADKAAYIDYWKKLQSFAKEGTILVADNAVDYGWLMKDFLDEVRADKNWDSLILPYDNGLL